MTSPISIEFLANRPEFVPQVAAWLHTQWYCSFGLSRCETHRQLQARLNIHQLPIAYVAVQGSHVVGTGSLIVDQLPTEPGDACWLAGLFVPSASRGLGIGAQLCRHIIHESEQMGISELYLYTSGCVPFYRRLGWRKLMEAAIPSGSSLELASLMKREGATRSLQAGSSWDACCVSSDSTI